MAKLLIAVGLCLLGALAQAGQYVDIYRVDTLVETQAVSERAEAARLALLQLMVRVSGKPEAANSPVVIAASKKAQNYLLEFSYAATEKRLVVNGEERAAVTVIFKFTPEAVHNLLREAGLPLWPANRPELLIWTVFEDETGTQYRVPETDLVAAMNEQASLRGLPLKFSAQDFEDNLAVPTSSLWELEFDNIKTGSERYKADAILVAKFQQQDGERWSSEWHLLQGSNVEQLTTSDEMLTDQAVQAINLVADSFAAQYAISESASAPQEVVLAIDGIKNYRQFKSLARYLESISMINQAVIDDVNGSQVRYRLAIQGNPAQLVNTLALGRNLIVHNAASAISAEQPVLDDDSLRADEYLEAPEKSVDYTVPSSYQTLQYHWQD